ncbi:hypothetical protein GCM10022255_050040 [Dactylosporangium darangshiense]|uniref:Uncharacterized protein n=1 Tax=Dactylosporangium darangshiense TaxID=579108 RepID=A0ABP8DCE3_9ACTN
MRTDGPKAAQVREGQAAESGAAVVSVVGVALQDDQVHRVEGGAGQGVVVVADGEVNGEVRYGGADGSRGVQFPDDAGGAGVTAQVSGPVGHRVLLLLGPMGLSRRLAACRT